MSKPPPALSDEEFKRRYQAGARTMEEIDPEFFNWLRKEKFNHKIKIGIIWIVFALLCGAGVICALLM